MRWRVIRQDDNGNVFVVAEVGSEAEARAIADQFTARAHKQFYECHPVEPDEPSFPRN
jgi:hypothetical protein